MKDRPISPVLTVDPFLLSLMARCWELGFASSDILPVCDLDRRVSDSGVALRALIENTLAGEPPRNLAGRGWQGRQFGQGLKTR
jgi:hypothetical protein